jgi:hypothetical protein
VVAAAIGALLVIAGLTWSLGATGNTTNSPTPAGAASVDATDAAAGKPFPHFMAIGPDGRPVTNTDLSGKPSIVWLTTLGCVPAQLGARQLARLDDRLGLAAPRVLVIFIDPAAPASALSSWRDTFGNPDWMVARDDHNRLASTVRLRYDDTKFLLDSQGRIMDVNLWPVDDHYLQLVRVKVQG